MGDLEEPCTYDALVLARSIGRCYLTTTYGFGEVDLNLAFPCVGRAYM